MDHESGLNPTLMQASSATFPLTTASEKKDCKPLGTSSANFYNFNNKCKKINLNSFFAGLWNHEGFGSTGVNGHESQARIAAADPANNVYNLVERVYGTTLDDVQYLAGDQAYQASQRISTVSADHSVVKNNWCGSLWQYDPTPAYWVYAALLTINNNCI